MGELSRAVGELSGELVHKATLYIQARVRGRQQRMRYQALIFDHRLVKTCVRHAKIDHAAHNAAHKLVRDRTASNPNPNPNPSPSPNPTPSSSAPGLILS